jgi:hypothetical protein
MVIAKKGCVIYQDETRIAIKHELKNVRAVAAVEK